LDLYGTWEHPADELSGQLDPELWRLTLNPWAVLEAVALAKLKAVALARARRQYLEATTWLQLWHAAAPLNSAAYFSMEFTLSEVLPI
jgi:glycogen phosphorylase